MSSYDFEHFSDGEWEDRGELAWNEFDWQQYLKQNEKEIARFLTLYQHHKHSTEHLDEVAHLMGWDDAEWLPLDESAGSSSIKGTAPNKGAASAKGAAPSAPAEPPAAADQAGSEAGDDSIDTYTIHKHPVFIATHGLYQHIYHVWEHFLANGNDLVINPSVAWKFAASLHAGELNSVMAIHALDLGDFALSICHLKNALSAVNHSLSMLQMLPLTHAQHHTQFFREVQTVLFDLREIWLRVMNDCREENHRRMPGGDDAAD